MRIQWDHSRAPKPAFCQDWDMQPHRSVLQEAVRQPFFMIGVMQNIMGCSGGGRYRKVSGDRHSSINGINVIN